MMTADEEMAAARTRVRAAIAGESTANGRPTPVVTYDLDATEQAALKRQAAAEHRSVSVMVAQAVRYYLANAPPPR